MAAKIFVALRALTFIGLWLVLGACASIHETSENYASIPQIPQSKSEKRTLVVILVDGFGANIFANNFDRLPAVTRYFGATEGHFPTAHSIFPSLTFPNLVTLLTHSPISQHSVMGNQMLLQSGGLPRQKVLNFEKQEDLHWLNQAKESAMVFSHQTSQGKVSASFAQSLFLGADLIAPADLEIGAAYLNNDYFLIDQKNLRSFSRLLTDFPASEWPDFVFIHLIGVDGTAHTKGPFAPEVAAYLDKLNQELAPIFEQLQTAQNQGAHIATLLTADHGFTTIQNRFDLERTLEPYKFELKLVNQGRIVALHFDPNFSLESQSALMTRLIPLPSVELIALHKENEIMIKTKQQQWTLRTRKTDHCSIKKYLIEYEGHDYCPDEIDDTIAKFILPPFAFQNIIDYFSAAQSPDAVVVAEDGYSFSNEYQGHHGGISQEETLVPLLLHGVKIKNNRIPALFEVLQGLN